MRILVTGAGGFVGKYLTEALLKKGHEVYGGVRNKKKLYLNKEVKPVHLDMQNKAEINQAVQDVKPEGIVHLAAQSNVPLSWKNPAYTFLVNTIGTIHLVNTAKKVVPGVKIISVGSSEEYGLSAQKSGSLTEEEPCMPQNPYAISKFSAGQAALQIARNENMEVIHVRPFNHFGPGQKIGYVVSDFASQIASIEKRRSLPKMKVGNLSAGRDFTDVRDIVDAYVLLLENPVETEIYNVCSGTPRSAKDILNGLLKHSRISIDVLVDPERFRPSSVPVFTGSYEKLNKATGWKPERPLEKTLEETVNWWRKYS